MDKEALIIGSSPAGIQAASNLADLGLTVHLVEQSPFIGEELGALLPSYLGNTRLLELLKDPDIQVWTNSEVLKVEKNGSGYQVKIQQNPRYVDLKKCTACGDCLEVCPITIPDNDQKAIRLGGQPDCAVISKAGISPCSNACPAGIHVQGYVALVGQSRYREAYELINNALPFPSVCGRVCNHLCETSCTRSQLDQAVNIMALKGFLADWAFDHKEETLEDSAEEKAATGKKVAIIGAGPAGLTAARDLIRLGHRVKIFDANPEPGGMMRVGIPPHRVSYEQLGWEIERILEEGIDLQLNTWVDDVPGLLNNGFDAVLAAAGAGVALKPDIKNVDHKDNWLSLDFLKRVSLGKGDDLSGRKVIVLGGGDVAMDSARSALRLGVEEVKILCRGIRASQHELDATLEEGIDIIQDRVFKEISLKGKNVEGVLCLEAEVGEVIDGKRQFTELPGTEHLIAGDLVIWALGQRINSSFLPEDQGLVFEGGRRVLSDDNLMTPLEGLFAAGDFRIGNTTFVVDAVGEGHLAAQAIHNYLLGLPGKKVLERTQVVLSQDEMEYRLENLKAARKKREAIPSLAVKDRVENFELVDQPLSEKKAKQEAGRCLACGPCSECMACVEVCKPGAINMDQTGTSKDLAVSAVFGEDQLGVGHALVGSAAVYQYLVENDHRKIVETRRYLQIDPVYSSGQKTGLLVCQCGGEISSALDTKLLCRDALEWPEIEFACELAFSCTEEGAEDIRRIAREYKLDKIILAACSCCSLDQVCYSCTYQRLRCRENLDVFTSLEKTLPIEFLNIREQCAWVYPRSRKKATDAARILIRSALAYASNGRNGKAIRSDIPNSVLIVGNGPSGYYCQEALKGLGLETQRAGLMAGDIIRAGGQYLADWGKEKYLADCLILAPGSGAELDHISGAVKLLNQQPLISAPRSDQENLDFGLMICPPELDPEISGRGSALNLYAWINRLSNRILQPTAVVDPSRCRACGTCREVCGYGIPVKVTSQYGTHAQINNLLCKDCGTCSAHCPSGAITPGTHSVSELENILEKILM